MKKNRRKKNKPTGAMVIAPPLYFIESTDGEVVTREGCLFLFSTLEKCNAFLDELRKVDDQPFSIATVPDADAFIRLVQNMQKLAHEFFVIDAEGPGSDQKRVDVEPFLRQLVQCGAIAGKAARDIDLFGADIVSNRCSDGLRNAWKTRTRIMRSEARI